MAQRVKVTGDLFNGHVPDGAIYCGRPAPGLRGSPWANPFKVGRPTPVTARLGNRPWTVGDGLAGCWPPDAEAAVAWFRSLVNHTELHATIRAELAGHDLACWCDEHQPCHVDVLLQVAGEGP